VCAAQLAPLTLATKQFLKERSLHHAYTGGLSSYCLVLLLAAFIKHADALEDPPPAGGTACACLGRLFADMLHFYGRVFDPRRSGVALTDAAAGAASGTQSGGGSGGAAAAPLLAGALFPQRGGREAAIDVLHIAVRCARISPPAAAESALLTCIHAFSPARVRANRTRCRARR
jgi:hypothetical protein